MEIHAKRVKKFLQVKVPKEFAQSGIISQNIALKPNPFEELMVGSNRKFKNQLENSQEKMKLFLSTNCTPLRESSAFRYLVSGGVAGAVSRTVTAPLDRLKLVLQVQSGQNSMAMSQCIRNMFHEGGLLSFYKGNGTNIVKIAPETGVKFFAYEKLKNLLSDDKKSITPCNRFLAGAMAGVIAQFTIYPLECVKTRLALAQPGTYKGIINCLSTTVSKEGYSTLYRGLGPSLMGVIPYAGIDLAVYESLKSLYISHTDKTSNQPSVLPLFLCGLTSSTCGQIVAYPLSLIRTRLQAQGMKGLPVMYSGSIDAFKKIISREGFFGLYKGILPNFLKVAPAVSISYVVYEKTKSLLE
jgi:solute carrier family 25 phosphate transporter 23/24/25/41